MVHLPKALSRGLAYGGFFLAAAVSAQTVGPGNTRVVPGSVDPGKISERFPARPEPTSTRVEPTAPPSPEPADADADADAQEMVFELEQIQILGSTLYSPERFDDLTQPLVAKRQISVADIQALVRDLRARYQADGYTLVRIRKPLFGFTGEGFIVRIEVVESHIEALTLPAGISETQEALYRGYSARLQADRPLSDRVYQRYSSLANDVPGGGVPLTLAPGSAPGALRLLIEPPQQRTFRFFTRLDNRGTEEHGPFQFTLGTQIRNPLRANDQLDLSYSGTIEFDELHYLAANYARALNAEGTTLTLSGTYSDGDPGTRILDRLDYRSDGYSLGFTLKHPLVRGLDFSTWVFGGYRYQDFRSDILDTTNTHDRLSLFDLGLSLDWADAVLVGRNALNLLTLNLFQGVDGLGSMDNDNQHASRGDGRVDFTRLTLNWYRLQRIANRWSAILNLHGQYARTPLLSSQECTYGGAIFGRGFEPSTLFGDHCILGSLELAYALDAPFPQLRNLRLFGFADYGKLWQKGFGIDTEGSSVGGGIRVTLFDRVSTLVEIARGNSAAVEDDGWELYFKIEIGW